GCVRLDAFSGLNESPEAGDELRDPEAEDDRDQNGQIAELIHRLTFVQAMDQFKITTTGNSLLELVDRCDSECRRIERHHGFRACVNPGGERLNVGEQLRYV